MKKIASKEIFIKIIILSVIIILAASGIPGCRANRDVSGAGLKDTAAAEQQTGFDGSGQSEEPLENTSAGNGNNYSGESVSNSQTDGGNGTSNESESGSLGNKVYTEEILFN